MDRLAVRRKSLGATLVALLASGAVLAAGGSAKPVATVDAAQLPPGQFAGKLVSLPDTKRMFTVAVIVPEVVVAATGKGGSMTAPTGGTSGGSGKGQGVKGSNSPPASPPSSGTSTKPTSGHTKGSHTTSGGPASGLSVQQQLAQVQKIHSQVLAGSKNRAAALAQLQRAVLKLQKMAAAGANGFKIVSVTVNIDFQADDEMKVRLLNPPVALDDEGNPSKRTPAELIQLKGKNKDLPGYEATLERLKVGQVVQVILATHVPDADDKKPAAGKKGMETDEEDEPAGPPEKKRQVRLLVIVEDAAPEPAKTTKRGKRKKN